MRGLKTRDRLVRSAVILFQQRGYHATGIAEILHHAEVPKGSLYHHFPGGKESLAAAALDWLTEEMVGHFDRCVASKQSAVETVTALYKGAANWLARHDYATGALFSVFAQEMSVEEPELSRLLGLSYRRVIAAFSRALTVDGRVAAMDGDALALTLLATLDGTIPIARSERSKAPILTALNSVRPLLDTEAAGG
ncbi:MAG: TetR/AcrR family transcriptional regulator [Rhizobiaceae bacterium]|nr:TetR/AcrR family transcriptional regulator [Rhizobiaceae bacterium]